MAFTLTKREAKAGDHKAQNRFAAEVEVRQFAAPAPDMFAGAQILHPRLFAAAPTGPFSLNLLYDRAQALGRPHGLRHDGHWFHIGTPEALRDAERTLARLP